MNRYEYLGDSVYAEVETDGTIALKLNHHLNQPIIYLDPEVQDKLVALIKDLPR